MEKNLRRAMLSCAGCTLMLFVTCGLAFNVFSAAQPYILAGNGFTNTQTSLITTIRSAAYLLGTFAIGRYYRRLGYRTGCALAAMLACVSFLLFAAAKAGRFLQIDAERALQKGCDKFIGRFRLVEKLTGDKPLSERPVEELEQLWRRAKEQET